MFVEMLLVRWVGTELRVFAYLQNGVLVAAFLGLGLGFRSARKPARLLPAVLVLFSVVFMVRDPLGWDIGEGVTQGLVAFQDSGIWYAAGGQAQWPQYVRTALLAYSVAVSLALLAAIAYVFRPLGPVAGRVDGRLSAADSRLHRQHPGEPPRDRALRRGHGRGDSPLLLAGGRRHRSRRCARRGPTTAESRGRSRSAWPWPCRCSCGTSAGTTLWSPYQKLSIEPLVYG